MTSAVTLPLSDIRIRLSTTAGCRKASFAGGSGLQKGTSARRAVDSAPCESCVAAGEVARSMRVAWISRAAATRFEACSVKRSEEGITSPVCVEATSNASRICSNANCTSAVVGYSGTDTVLMGGA